jgi:hypothetical protein
MLPPTIFFYIGFNLIALTTNLIVADYGAAFGSFMLATGAFAGSDRVGAKQSCNQRCPGIQTKITPQRGNCPDRVPSTFEAVHRIADAVNAVAATTVLVLLSETVSEVVP